MDEDLPRLPGFREAALRRRRETIGALADHRRAAGLSQTEVAARMGTSQSTIARLEAGEVDPRISTLERYAEALGGRLDVALRFDPVQSPQPVYLRPVGGTDPFAAPSAAPTYHPGIAPGFAPAAASGGVPDPADSPAPTSPADGRPPEVQPPPPVGDRPARPSDRRW